MLQANEDKKHKSRVKEIIIIIVMFSAAIFLFSFSESQKESVQFRKFQQDNPYDMQVEYVKNVSCGSQKMGGRSSAYNITCIIMQFHGENIEFKTTRASREDAEATIKKTVFEGATVYYNQNNVKANFMMLDSTFYDGRATLSFSFSIITGCYGFLLLYAYICSFRTVELWREKRVGSKLKTVIQYETFISVTLIFGLIGWMIAYNFGINFITGIVGLVLLGFWMSATVKIFPGKE